MKLLSHGSTKPGGDRVITALPSRLFLSPRRVSNYGDISGRTSVKGFQGLYLSQNTGEMYLGY